MGVVERAKKKNRVKYIVYCVTEIIDWTFHHLPRVERSSEFKVTNTFSRESLFGMLTIYLTTSLQFSFSHA